MSEDVYRVLVIDDDANMRMLLKLFLKHHGHAVLLAPDGEVGLALAETADPDIILLDLAIPQRSGLEIYLDLQENPQTASIPIIIFSAALSPRDLDSWRSLPQVVDVLLKPFDMNALLVRIAETGGGRVNQVCA